MKNYEDLIILNNLKTVCLIGHSNADADSLASMVVFKNFLINHFKVEQVDLFADDSIITNTYSEFISNTEINNSPLEHYDAAIMLDTAKVEKLGNYKNLFNQSKIKINIDHHNTNEQSGNINIIEQISSTSELIFKICKHFNYKLSTEECGMLYAGIITDTNNLTVGNFNDETFAIISEFINDINHEEIYNHFFNNNSLTNMKLLARAINNISAYENDEIIITHIKEDDLLALNATHFDLVGIINRIATINTAKLVCFIYPQNNLYYVSMRGRKGFSVAEIAKKHNGGGHLGAAAFNSNQNIDEISKLILQEFKTVLNKTQFKPIKCFTPKYSENSCSKAFVFGPRM